jgi:hypothetical protein
MPFAARRRHQFWSADVHYLVLRSSKAVHISL